MGEVCDIDVVTAIVYGIDAPVIIFLRSRAKVPIDKGVVGRAT